MQSTALIQQYKNGIDELLEAQEVPMNELVEDAILDRLDAIWHRMSTVEKNAVNTMAKIMSIVG